MPVLRLSLPASTLMPRSIHPSTTSTWKYTPALLSSPPLTTSHRHQGLLHEFKESVLNVSEVTYDEKSLKKRPPKKYEFPSGYNHSFGVERFRLPESLFAPPAGRPGISALLSAALTRVDPETRPLVHQNFIVAGGGMLMPGISDRAYTDLHSSLPGSKVKIHAASGGVDRAHAAWIGGSILGCMDNFAPLWISADMYKEHGCGVEARVF